MSAVDRQQIEALEQELARTAARAHDLSNAVSAYQYAAALVVELATGDAVALAGPRALLAAARFLRIGRKCKAQSSYGSEYKKAREAIDAALAADQKKELS